MTWKRTTSSETWEDHDLKAENTMTPKQTKHYDMKAQRTPWPESTGNTMTWKQREHHYLKAKGTSWSESKGNTMIWKQREHHDLKAKRTPRPESKGNTMIWKQREHHDLKAKATPWSESSFTSLHLSLNHGGSWGTTDDFTTSFLHFSLFSNALWNLVNSRPVHSLMLPSHLFFCLLFLLSLFTEPCKMVLARPDERQTCKYHFSLCPFTMVTRSSCGPIACCFGTDALVGNVVLVWGA